MQVFVNVALKSTRSVRGNRASQFHGAWFTVTRLYGPVRESHLKGEMGRGYIWADIVIPDELKPHVSVAGFNADGTIRVQVWVNTHRKTLAPFFASGLDEMDVRGMP
jgi:hypothetical protein